MFLEPRDFWREQEASAKNLKVTVKIHTHDVLKCSAWLPGSRSAPTDFRVFPVLYHFRGWHRSYHKEQMSSMLQLRGMSGSATEEAVGVHDREPSNGQYSEQTNDIRRSRWWFWGSCGTYALQNPYNGHDWQALLHKRTRLAATVVAGTAKC